MGIISWVVIGAIAGVVARRIVPGPDPGRSIITIILGMAGASLGGFVFGVLGGGGNELRSTVLTGSNVGCSSFCCAFTAWSHDEQLDEQTRRSYGK